MSASESYKEEPVESQCEWTELGELINRWKSMG